MSLRNAPRNKVVAIRKTGGWGKVQWQHELDCGHIEVRKRKAAGSALACSHCLRKKQGIDPFLDIQEVDDWLMAETEIEDVRRRLGNSLQVPPDLVTVVPEGDGFKATVILPPSLVERLLR